MIGLTWWGSAAENEHRVNHGRPTSGSLGLAALVSIGIGGMVGGGIFSVLGLTVQIAGGGAYLSFVVGGGVAALTGWSYSVLSVRIRSRGGTAVFLDRAFGTSVAGPLNLLLWLSYFVMLGLYAVAFGAYLAALLGLNANGPWPRVFASAVVVCFAALNLAGAQLVGRAESVLVYFKLAVLLLFCLGGLAFVNPARVSPAAFPSAGAIIYAGALIFLGYEGFELIANASEDARNPERTLPRAYLIAIGGVIALYVLVAFVAVGNLSPHAIATESDYALAAAPRPLRPLEHADLSPALRQPKRASQPRNPRSNDNRSHQISHNQRRRTAPTWHGHSCPCACPISRPTPSHGPSLKSGTAPVAQPLLAARLSTIQPRTQPRATLPKPGA